METRKYVDLVKLFCRRNGLPEEIAQSILEDYFDRSINTAINKKSHAVKRSFIFSCSLRYFNPEEKFKDYNHDKLTKKKLIIDLKMPEKYKKYTFIPSKKHLELFQSKIEQRKVTYHE